MGIRPEHYFWTKEGKQIKNLFELAQSIENMPDETFSHHLNTTKNDFYNWVMFVCKDRALAEKIKNLKKQKEVANTIRQKLAPKKMKISSISTVKPVETIRLMSILDNQKIADASINNEKTDNQSFNEKIQSNPVLLNEKLEIPHYHPSLKGMAMRKFREILKR